MTNLEYTIKRTLADLAERYGHEGVAINGDTRVFNDLGLDSFAFAELVLVLELETGLDPFTQAGGVISVRTVDDIVRVYSESGQQNSAQQSTSNA